jgi:general stress protein 26
MQDPKHDEPGHIRDYEGKEAIDKLKKLAEDARICMFVTYIGKEPSPSRPMALQQVDENGALFFFSAASSEKNFQLQNDSGVQLYFANGSASEYLSIYGRATISQDRAKIHELWNSWAKTWFQNGPDDPDLTLIKVQPISCEYWDTKHNKAVQLLKIAASMVTGKTMDDAVEGELRV